MVNEYNEIYYKPTKKMLDELYVKELLDKSRYFDERLEVIFMNYGTTKDAGPEWERP